MAEQAVLALARSRALWQGSARLVEACWPILVSGACCRSSVVEHSIGNGEVDSSILSGSTILYFEKASEISKKPRFRPFVDFGHFSYVGRNRP
jgi:hypothetical protein